MIENNEDDKRKRRLRHQVDDKNKQQKAASLRRRIKALLHNRCFICDYNSCLRALEFHHLNAERKHFNVSMNVLRYKWETIAQELSKGVLLCNRCHTEVEDGITLIEEGDVPSGYYDKVKATMRPPKDRFSGYGGKSRKPYSNRVRNQQRKHK